MLECLVWSIPLDKWRVITKHRHQYPGHNLPVLRDEKIIKQFWLCSYCICSFEQQWSEKVSQSLLLHYQKGLYSWLEQHDLHKQNYKKLFSCVLYSGTQASPPQFCGSIKLEKHSLKHAVSYRVFCKVHCKRLSFKSTGHYIYRVNCSDMLRAAT